MTMTAERDTTGRPPRGRRGSALSDRQVAFAVRDGKAVTATLTAGEKIRGFVFGTDDFHWSIVDKDGGVHLVHKSSPALSIDSLPSIDSASTTVREMVRVFREFVLREHFNQSTTPTPSRQHQKD